MGTVQSSVGLISGINSADIIDQLLAIEARPRALAQQRLVQIQSQQAAFLDLNTAVLGLTTAAKSFNVDRLFRGATATSSNPDALSATASTGAAVGSYNFVVDRLVSTHSAISKGFADRDSTGLGLDELSFEVGGGRLDSDTLLENLNGGTGFERGKIVVTDSAGESATIDLTRAVTVSDVLNAINSNSDISVEASVDGYGLTLTDTAGGGGNLKVEDQFGSNTASTLGIAGNEAGGVINGSRIQRLGGDTVLSILNDGNGVSFGAGGVAPPADFVINVDGTDYNITLGELAHTEPDPDDASQTITVIDEPAVVTIDDVIERIESQTSGAVEVNINSDGTGLELDAGSGTITITNGPTASTAAVDLGFLDRGAASNSDTGTLDSRRLLAGLNSRLASNLGGGQGVSSGTIGFVTSDATAFGVALTGDESISEIIDAINDQSGGAVTASLNQAGNGLLITDNTSGGGQLQIADAIGQAAEDLNIDTPGSDGSVDSGNLQTRYVSQATLLENLRGGQGIGTGSFRITDSDGTSSTVTINDDDRTVADILRKINSAGADVVARINDNGDGIVIEDAAGGANAITIENTAGTVASNLRIAGTADLSTGSNELDGSGEVLVDLEAGDTLQDIVNAINNSSADVNASIVSSGSGPSPHRLVITSQASGARGRVLIDTFGENLGLNTLSRGQDAVAFFGAENAADGFLLTSNTNTFSDVIEGVTLNLNSASDEPVEINVARDIESIENGFQLFVDAYNNVLDRIDFHTRYDQETEERGVLLGDSTALSVKSTLSRLVLTNAPGVEGAYKNLTQIGFSIGDGGQLSFDSAKFRDAYEADPQGVQDLVAALDAAEQEEFVPVLDENGNPLDGVTTRNDADTEYTRLGVFENIAQYAESLTDFVDGRFTRRRNTFETQVGLQEDRIGQLTVQLDIKRARLQQQFLAMEQAIASIQGQQTALASIGAG